MSDTSGGCYRKIRYLSHGREPREEGEKKEIWDPRGMSGGALVKPVGWCDSVQGIYPVLVPVQGPTASECARSQKDPEFEVNQSTIERDSQVESRACHAPAIAE